MKKILFLFLLSVAFVLAFSSCGSSTENLEEDAVGEICQEGKHDFSLWQVEVEATCKNEGYKKRTCQICKLYSERIKYTNTTNHKYDENFVCTLCGVATTPTKVAFLMSDDGTYYTLNYVSDKQAKEYTVPETYEGLPVLEIASGAFENCKWLETVVVPSSVKKIGEGAFAGCPSLKKITLPFVGMDETNANSLFGYIFGVPEDKKGLVGITQYKGDQESKSNSVEYWIPESLVDVTITGGSIYDGAFRNCSKIKRLSYTGSGEVIGNYAFSGCILLDEFEFPITVSAFGDRVFQNCYELNTFPLIKKEGVEKIGAYCFAGCLFSAVEFPASLKSVGEGAFADCSNIKDVFIPSNLRNLPNKMFQDCVSITTVTLSSDVRSIGRSCFSGCTSLSSIDFSNTVEEIEKLAFNNCYALKEVVLSPSVKTIESGAFQGCINLATISLGSSLEKIETQAFEGCTALVSIHLPKTVSEIEENSFRNCSSLTAITIEEGNESFSSVEGNIYNYSKTRLLLVSPGFNLDTMIIPEGVKDIDAGAFNNAKAIKKVVFPSTVTEISAGLFKDNTSIISLDLTGEIQTIHKEAFALCTALQEVIIEYVNTIDVSAFQQCPSLKTVTISNVGTIGEGAFYKCEKLESLTLSDIKEIGQNAFAECKSLKTVDMNNNVKKIGKEAFSSCTALETVLFGSALTEIGEFAFSDCKALKTVEFQEGIETIDDAAFRRCTALEKIVLPFSITHVTAYAFEGCTSLVDISVAEGEAPPVYYTWDGHLVKIDVSSGELRYVLAVFAPGKIEETIVLPGVDEIGIYAFRNVTGFKHVIINEETKVIGREAFFNSSLKSIELSNVEKIGDYAFGHCLNLKNFIVPRTVTYLGSYAFQYCYNLENLYLSKKLTHVGNAILHKNKEHEDYVDIVTNIYVEISQDDFNEETEAPEGWDELWYNGSYASIKYNFDYSDLNK